MRESEQEELKIPVVFTLSALVTLANTAASVVAAVKMSDCSPFLGLAITHSILGLISFSGMFCCFCCDYFPKTTEY